MAYIKLAVFDVAGTTAKDNGLVLKAAQEAIVKNGISENSEEFNEATDYVILTMGQRKIDVFNNIFRGEIKKAKLAHDDFVHSYTQLVKNGELEEFDGISDFFQKLKNLNIGVALTTGFPREILDSIISSLGWRDLINVSVAASEVGKGRPAPDMVFKSIEIHNLENKLDITPSEIAVIGDTISDMQSGVAAKAKYVVGVTSGLSRSESLYDAGATHVIDFATQLLTVVN